MKETTEMRISVLSASAALGFVAFAQGDLTFEVASVRQWDSRSRTMPKAVSGGPGTDDPERMAWAARSLGDLLEFAYGVKPEQISGPSWVTSDDLFVTTRYDIVAKIPEGASIEQVRAMLRNLLAERFGLVLHHELRNFPAYELMVAKSGPKLKLSSIDPNKTAPPRKAQAQVLHDGIVPQLQEGFADIVSSPPGPSGMWHTTARGQTVSGIIRFLKTVTDSEVIDKTGLSGVYDFDLEYTTEGLTGTFSNIAGLIAQKAAALQAREGNGNGQVQSGDGPTLFSALEKQLGLRIESIKIPIDTLVIDHVEKTPTEN
jgi:uncharacterized protein (TIGR03435 family)